MRRQTQLGQIPRREISRELAGSREARIMSADSADSAANLLERFAPLLRFVHLETVPRPMIHEQDKTSLAARCISNHPEEQQHHAVARSPEFFRSSRSTISLPGHQKRSAKCHG